MNLLWTIQGVWLQYRAFQALVDELDRRSDRDLNVIGIARADIPRIAYAEAERHVGIPRESRLGTRLQPVAA